MSLTEALFDDLEILTANDEMVSVNDSQPDNSGSLVSFYPNPFSDRVTINYNLPVASSVSLKIFNLMGQEVASLVDSEQNAGANSATWNALDFSGNKMQPGLYIYKLQFNGQSATGKLMLK
jgi:flagellar hook assembly protein FlgD